MKKILISLLLLICSVSTSFGYFDEQIDGMNSLFEGFSNGTDFYGMLGKASVQDFTDDMYAAAQRDDQEMLGYFRQLDPALLAKKSDPDWLVWLQEQLSPVITSKLEKETLNKNDKRALVLAGYLYIRCDILLSEQYYEKDYTLYTHGIDRYSISYPNNWTQEETSDIHPDGPSFMAPGRVPMFGILVDDSIVYDDDAQTLLSFMQSVKEFLTQSGMIYLDSGSTLIGGDSAVYAKYQVEPGIPAYVDQIYAIHDGKIYAFTLGYSSESDLQSLTEILATFEF